MSSILKLQNGDRVVLRKLCLAFSLLLVIGLLPTTGLATTPSPTVSLTPSVATPQMLGTPITWTATVKGGVSGHTYDYQFIVTPYNGKGKLQIVRDSNPNNTFVWVQHTVEGSYQVSVQVRDLSTTPWTHLPQVNATFNLKPWVTTPTGAAVNKTTHPLVALFSGPACTSGNTILVRFTPASSTVSNTTSPIPCSTNTANFYVAGMYPSTEYMMHWEQYNGTTLVSTGTNLPFTTGALPTAFVAPTYKVNVPPTAHDADYPVVLWHHLAGNWPAATDLTGKTMWYFHVPSGAAVTRMEPGGLFYSVTNTIFSQYDLAGNEVLETNMAELNRELAALGYPQMTSFNAHEGRNLPNGNVVVLGARDVASTSLQGGTPTDPVDIIGDMILVLDHNLRLVWAWDSFAHQDVSRVATLNDKCTQGGGGCPAFNPAFTVANDWLHSNALQGTADGNIIISERSQDWVLKINYANGTGDGSVLWTMGAGGDITLLNPPSETCGSPNVYPWFTHQHDPNFQIESDATTGGIKVMTVFDDGNTRAAECSGTQNSRGMVLLVDEANKQAYMETAGDLGAYSYALGASQFLYTTDGNIYASYDNGIIAGVGAQSTEISLSGDIVYQLQADGATVYRIYRMQNLDTPPLP